MYRRFSVILLVFFAGLAGGCQPPDYTAGQRYQRGLVVCLPGAGGGTFGMDRLRQGLYEAGVEHALEIFHWSRRNVLDDQINIQENRLKARELARRIEDYRMEHPHQPVYLVGLSAGTGIVVWTLEELSPGHKVTGAVLISSSLSYRYDLSVALQRVDGCIHNFFNPTDAVLALAVPVAGTVDRQAGRCGGQRGFELPKNANRQTRALYESKIVQHPWQPGDVWLGDLPGDHLGATSQSFVRQRIAPLLLAESSQAFGGE